MTSEKATKRVNDYSEHVQAGRDCPVCLEPYTSPRVLVCGHQFCEACLRGITTHMSQGQVPCPSCRRVTQLDKKDVSALPEPPISEDVRRKIACLRTPPPVAEDQGDEFGRTCDVCHIESARVKCQDCQTCLCEICLVKHQQISVLSGHSIDYLSRNTYCADHPSDVVCVYCHDCKKLVCFKCLLSTHQGHTKENMKSLASQSKILMKTFDCAQKSCGIDMQVVQGMRDAMTRMKEGQSKARLVVRDVTDAVTELCALMEETLAAMDEHADRVLKNVTGKLAHIDDVRTAQEMLGTFTDQLLTDGSETELIGAMNTLPCIKNLQLETVVANIPQFNDILGDFLQKVRYISKRKFFAITSLDFCVAEHRKPWKLEYVNEVVKGDYKVTGVKFNSAQTELIVRTTDPDSSLHCFRFSTKAQAFTLLRHFAIPEINNWSRPLSLDTKRSLVLAPCGRNGLYRIEPNGNIVSRIPSFNMDFSAVEYSITTDQYILSDEQTGRLVIVNPVTKKVIKTLPNKESSPSFSINLASLTHPYQLAVSYSSHNKIHVYDSKGEMRLCLGPQLPVVGKLCHPMGVGYDLGGSLLVCDSGNCRVLRVWEDTKEAQCLLGREELGGEPTLVDVDSTNRYVAVLVGCNTVKIYSY